MMENTMVFLLLLLLCSLSSADKASSEEESVLKDMVSALTEHRVSFQYLQTQNQEHSDKPTVSEEDNSELELMKQQLQALAAELKLIKEQTREVDLIKQQLQAQAAELNSIKTWSNITENQVDALMRDKAVEQVAFSASLSTSGRNTLGPFSTLTTLVFKRVVSNIGNAYNNQTGLFTAPVRGAYHFELHIGYIAEAPYASGALLMKNQELIAIAYEVQSDGFGSSANTATLLLEPGDVVFVHQWYNSKIFDNENHHTTFSGHLLFVM